MEEVKLVAERQGLDEFALHVCKPLN